MSQQDYACPASGDSAAAGNLVDDILNGETDVGAHMMNSDNLLDEDDSNAEATLEELDLLE